MSLPDDIFYLLVSIVVIAIAMAVVHYFTKSGRNFRSSRNKKARKPF